MIIFKMFGSGLESILMLVYCWPLKCHEISQYRVRHFVILFIYLFIYLFIFFWGGWGVGGYKICVIIMQVSKLNEMCFIPDILSQVNSFQICQHAFVSFESK